MRSRIMVKCDGDENLFEVSHYTSACGEMCTEKEGGKVKKKKGACRYHAKDVDLQFPVIYTTFKLSIWEAGTDSRVIINF